MTLGDLPVDEATVRAAAPPRRYRPRRRPGLPVLVDHDGVPYPPDEVPLRLRMARSTRISIEGNAHFCRGLLRTRYPDIAPHHEETAS